MKEFLSYTNWKRLISFADGLANSGGINKHNNAIQV